MLVLAPTVGHSAVAYKIPMTPGAQAQQYVVYARVADHGFGVQYWRDNKATQVGGLFGLLGTAVGAIADDVATNYATSRSQDDVEKIAAFMEHAAAQQDFENALREALVSVPLFASPLQVNELGASAKTDAGAFNEARCSWSSSTRR
jgi:hypothetical protein